MTSGVSVSSIYVWVIIDHLGPPNCRPPSPDLVESPSQDLESDRVVFRIAQRSYPPFRIPNTWKRGWTRSGEGDRQFTQFGGPGWSRITSLARCIHVYYLCGSQPLLFTTMFSTQSFWIDHILSLVHVLYLATLQAKIHPIVMSVFKAPTTL